MIESYKLSAVPSIVESIAKSLARGGHPLSDEQQMLLAGALLPWLERMKIDKP